MAALDSQAKRMAAAAMALPCLIAGVYADATRAFGWRLAAGWSYPNELVIGVAGPVTKRDGIFRHAHELDGLFAYARKQDSRFTYSRKRPGVLA